jgi:hypothetical protein
VPDTKVPVPRGAPHSIVIHPLDIDAAAKPFIPVKEIEGRVDKTALGILFVAPEWDRYHKVT